MSLTPVFFHEFADDLAKGVHENCLIVDTDTLKIALSNTAPNAATDKVFADITEIAAGNGYTAGGLDLQNVRGKTGALILVNVTDPSWTASGGSIGPFRYLIVYNDTPASPAKPLILFYDRGSEITRSNGQTYELLYAAELLKV